MTEYERMLSGALYISSDADLVQKRNNARRLTRLFNMTTEEETEYRIALLQELFAKAGKNIYIEPAFRCDYGCNIVIGDNFYANFDCIILDVGTVTILDNVMLGPRVGIYTAGHPIEAAVRNAQLEFGKPVVIGDNVWIGGDAVINPGVNIGNNAIIGSGSVVTKSIPDNVIAAGNPCRVIREIHEEDRRYWEERQRDYMDSGLV